MLDPNEVFYWSDTSENAVSMQLGVYVPHYQVSLKHLTAGTAVQVCVHVFIMLFRADDENRSQ